MGGELLEYERGALEAMIGTGPKSFVLLYSVTSDGCDPAVFHQKCDNKGATVTVLYNKHGSAFGGYTNANWTSDASGVYTADDKAFLFQLRHSGSKVVRRFPTKDPNYSIYCHSDFGPTFGNNFNLKTFEKTVTISGKTFPLNGSLTANDACYDHQGVSANNVNNGSMEVAELEVYSVQNGYADQVPSKSWRKTPDLDEEMLQALMKEIESIRPPMELEIQDYRILMLGPLGSGKSSFCNTVNSVFAGRITQRAICGSNKEYSTTTAYTPFVIPLESGSALNVRLCDTRGLEETQGIDAMECSFLVNGNIPEYYEFNPATSIDIVNPEFDLKPTPSDRVHCVVFVIDATTVDTLSDNMRDKIKGFRKIFNQKRIPQAVILTKIDEINNRVKGSLSNVFTIPEVEDKVKRVSDLLGLPPNNVLPVKNYVTEIQLDDSVSALALLAFRQVLYFAEDYMKNLLMQRERMKREAKIRRPVYGISAFSNQSDEYALEDEKPSGRRKKKGATFDLEQKVTES